MPVTASTGNISAQFQSYFSKQLLTMVQQRTILDQFATKAPVPKRSGALGNQQTLSVFRQGAPSISGVASLTEGTAIAAANYRQLSLNRIQKTVTQYGQVIGLTDIATATALFNVLEQATTTQALDIALWVDSVMRNVLVGSTLASSGASIGGGIESPIDNSDAINTATGSGGIKMFGNPATLATQTFDALNTNTTAANVIMSSATVLDAVTRLKTNRAPMINGGYVLATDPRVARDLMRDSDWLNASNYGNSGKPFYRGEVGSIYGVRVVEQTNSFVCRGPSTGTATTAQEFTYSNPTGGGTATATDIIASFFFGGEAFAIPFLSGDDPMSPRMTITDTPDKADPLNQLTTVGTKLFFTALRTAAGNTASTGNPAWYICHRGKTTAAA